MSFLEAGRILARKKGLDEIKVRPAGKKKKRKTKKRKSKKRKTKKRKAPKR